MMDSYISPLRQPVLILGSIAAEILNRPGSGLVEAVFETTFYVAVNSQLICVGRIDMKLGPVNCITRTSNTMDWRTSGLKRGVAVTIGSETITVGDKFQFSLDRTRIWLPKPPARSLEAGKISKGIAALQRALTGRDDIDGLGRFMIPKYRPKPNDYVCRAAESPIGDAGKWLRAGLRPHGSNAIKDLAWVEKLSGLGPGLTPSGDDFLGGIMIALHTLGNAGLSRQLWPTIKRYTEENSNSISLTHVSAASSGLGAAAIHEMLSAVLSGDAAAIDTVIYDVAAIGHSSGWDIMAGILMTLEAWVTVAVTKHTPVLGELNVAN